MFVVQFSHSNVAYLMLRHITVSLPGPYMDGVRLQLVHVAMATDLHGQRLTV